MSMSKLRQVSFAWGGATITVEGSAGKHRLIRDMVVSEISRHVKSQLERYQLIVVARLFVQTIKIEGDLGFKIPGDMLNIDALRDAAFTVLEHPEDLLAKWTAALEEATYGERDMLMPDQTDPLADDSPTPPPDEPKADK